MATEEPTTAQIKPHRYIYGGFEVMGDCDICGHVDDDPIHIVDIEGVRRKIHDTQVALSKGDPASVRHAAGDLSDAVAGLCNVINTKLEIS